MSDEINTRVADYQILGVLGTGGMGRVYKVRNVISDRVEAMKILLPNLAASQDLAERKRGRHQRDAAARIAAAFARGDQAERRQAHEGVERNHRRHWREAGVVDLQLPLVERLHDVAVPGAQSLVGGLDGKRLAVDRVQPEWVGRQPRLLA